MGRAVSGIWCPGQDEVGGLYCAMVRAVIFGAGSVTYWMGHLTSPWLGEHSYEMGIRNVQGLSGFFLNIHWFI